MKLVIILLVAIAMCGYYVSDYMQEQSAKKTRQADFQKKKERKRAAVAQLASKHNAIHDWEDLLRKDRGGNIKKISSYQLEKLWLTDRPIVFKGRIKDISNFDNNNYLVLIDGTSGLSKQLSLYLISSKSIIDSFISAYPKAASGLSSVAVVTKVNKVETKFRDTGDNDKYEIRAGAGNCLDIILYSDSVVEDTLSQEDTQKGQTYAFDKTR